MKKNMGLADRILRFAAALVFVVLFFTGRLAAPWSYVFPALSAIFILTAYTGIWPLYRLLRTDTRQFKEADLK